MIRRSAVLLLSLSLAACDPLNGIPNLVSGISQIEITPSAASKLGTAFDGLAALATGYINSCAPRPLPAQCSRDAINQLIPAIRSGRIVELNLKALAKTTPNAVAGSGLYEKLSAFVSTMQGIFKQYKIGGAS